MQNFDSNECFTLTFGDCAENHKGMQIIGDRVDEGFTAADIISMTNNLKKFGAEFKLYDLGKMLDEKVISDPVYLLIVKNGVNKLLNDDNAKEKLFSELRDLDYDSKAFMYGRVVNKNARHNLCIADFAQEPNYDEGKGRIIKFSDVPIMSLIRKKLAKVCGPKASKLLGEINHYYDTTICGIGYHGDTERNIVIGVRSGKSIPLAYQWYYKGDKVGKRMLFENIEDGDIYIMSEKASGNDWKKKNIYTLRHAAGCEKFTAIK